MICGKGKHEPLNFGDQVYYFIPGHGTPGGHAFVAGEMSYSEDGSVVLLVNIAEIGMPIAAGHCQVFSRGHAAMVGPLRERYLAQWPKALKPLPELPKPAARNMEMEAYDPRN